MSHPDLQPNSRTLTVYKASAGSGKTFRLAVEYIKLLLEDSKAYEGILAVTFTNKATEEMKMRILSTLYGLSKKLPDSQSYMDCISKESGMSEETISHNSATALHLLLHHYQYFKVQTIDTFFQSVLRNLARELQLSANLRVGLNTKEVVDEAVDEIIDTLDKDTELRNVVMAYIEDSIADGKKWNVINDIKKFGRTIFTELYKENRTEMDRIFKDKEFFDRYKSELRKLMKDTKKKYIDVANDILQKMEEAGLSIEDFANKGNGPMSYFLKLSRGDFAIKEEDLVNKTLREARDEVSKWYTKTSKRKDDITAFYDNILKSYFSYTEPQRERDAKNYRSAIATLQHLNDVRLLKRIEDMAHSLNDTSSRFMLSDTQSLLHEIIKEDDSPFIFEKIGAHLKHVMIDEFQDTSTVQWANFKVLLKECMSQGFHNLVVGDVKQSIYRFRNGDWHLLNNIDSEFSRDQLEFPPMSTNWRSCRNIIAFNNAFFKILAELEVQDVARFSQSQAISLSKAYTDVEQEIPNKARPGGLVHIEMLPSDQKDTMAEHTLETILSLMERGIEQKSISILMRRTRDIPDMAAYIEQESAQRGCPVRIISSEAFRLDASSCVRILINAMTLLAHPDDQMAMASLVTDFHRTIHHVEDVTSNIFATGTPLEQFLPKKFTTCSKELSCMSLTDMAETLMRLFSIHECHEEGAYITTFLDCLHSHCNEQMPTLEDFLDKWQSDYSSKTIEAAEVDGVRILTIHKSKGLEFDNVIIPYCNWSGNPPETITIWTQTDVPTFSELPLIPVGYKQESSLKGTIYEDAAHEEYIQNIVDNLNLLYVAFTRAKSSLFVFGENDTKRFSRSKAICNALPLLPDEINGEKLYRSEPMIVDFGTLSASSKDSATSVSVGNSVKEPSRNVFTPDIHSLQAAIASFPMRAEFRQSNESRRFADDTLDEKDNNRWIRLGTIMHQVFSTIRTLSDVEPVLRNMEFDGTLYDKDLTREEVIESMRKKFDDPQVKGWFSDGWQVFNECTVITSEGEQRPDRVITNGTDTIVIDFKFGKQKAEHIQQVQGYMTLLSQLEMPSVQGFLWYVSLNKIVKVFNFSEII